MKLSKDNKEALKSSVMVGLAYALIGGGVCLATDKPYLLAMAVLFVAGLLLGLTTTWDVEEE